MPQSHPRAPLIQSISCTEVDIILIRLFTYLFTYFIQGNVLTFKKPLKTIVLYPFAY